jgi:putative ABC transport system permease protein
MRTALYLAWAYIRFNAARSAILVVVLAVVASIPLAVERLSAQSEVEMMRRAETTPLIYGAPGSPLDLSLSALYFERAAEAEISMADYDRLAETGLARLLPILRRHQARGFPIVGVDFDYFDFRGLVTAEGRLFAWLGECVIGAEVAARLGLGPGDAIISETESLFELAGAYPLKMTVTGVLAPSGTADDRAVFASLKTAWVVAGLGHGHQDLATTGDDSVVLAREPGRVVANAKLAEYLEITEDNIDGFHFHGDPAGFPITAILVAPRDAKSAALLRGRIDDAGARRQVFRPTVVLRGLLDDILRLKDVLNLLVAAVGGATLAALGLIIALSIRLRAREFEIARRMGGDRLAAVRLLAAEFLILGGVGAIACLAVLAVADRVGGRLVRLVVFGD